MIVLQWAGNEKPLNREGAKGAKKGKTKGPFL